MSAAPVDPVQRALRALGRFAELNLSGRELDRLERRVMDRVSAAERSALPAWLPAAAAAAVIALIAFRLTGGPGPRELTGDPATKSGATAVSAAATGRPTPQELEAFSRAGSPMSGDARRVLLADFERVSDLAALRFGGEARVELATGGFTGSMALSTPSEDGLVELTVPAGHRLAAIGASVRVRAPGEGVAVTITAGLEDGGELLMAEDRPSGGDDWRLVVFGFDGDRVRAGGGVRWLRVSLAGRVPAKLDTMELWTTATEARR